MKSVLVLALALCSTAAFARPNTTALSCADAQDLVAREGSIVLNTGAPGLYQRFVAGARFCGISEKAAAAYVTTADAASCKIGYYCGNSTGDNPLLDKKFPSKYTKCVAGARRLESVRDTINDHIIYVAKVCTANGKWVNADGSVPAKPVKYVCKEGKIQPQTFRDYTNDHSVQGAVQCRAGKWIRIR
jgi:hypothetical protein